MNEKLLSQNYGKVVDMGDIRVSFSQRPSGECETHQNALLIKFQSPEAMKQAIREGVAKFGPFSP